MIYWILLGRETHQGKNEIKNKQAKKKKNTFQTSLQYTVIVILNLSVYAQEKSVLFDQRVSFISDR